MQQLQSTQLPMYPRDPISFTFHLKNYHHLPPGLQRQTRAALAEFFHCYPQIQADGSIKMLVHFILPVHSGQYQRRVEMLIFQLRSYINAGLEFDTSFGY
jgi:hypothetical protein